MSREAVNGLMQILFCTVYVQRVSLPHCVMTCKAVSIDRNTNKNKCCSARWWYGLHPRRWCSNDNIALTWCDIDIDIVIDKDISYMISIWVFSIYTIGTCHPHAALWITQLAFSPRNKLAAQIVRTELCSADVTLNKQQSVLMVFQK